MFKAQELVQPCFVLKGYPNHISMHQQSVETDLADGALGLLIHDSTVILVVASFDPVLYRKRSGGLAGDPATNQSHQLRVTVNRTNNRIPYPPPVQSFFLDWHPNL